MARQVTATWYTPEEKLPPEYESVVVSITGHIGDHTYFDHAIEVAEWADDGCGWMIYGLTYDEDSDITIDAWCDLEAYEEGEEDGNGEDQGRV